MCTWGRGRGTCRLSSWEALRSRDDRQPSLLLEDGNSSAVSPSPVFVVILWSPKGRSQRRDSKNSPFLIHIPLGDSKKTLL